MNLVEIAAQLRGRLSRGRRESVQHRRGMSEGALISAATHIASMSSCDVWVTCSSHEECRRLYLGEMTAPQLLRLTDWVEGIAEAQQADDTAGCMELVSDHARDAPAHRLAAEDERCFWTGYVLRGQHLRQQRAADRHSSRSFKRASCAKKDTNRSRAKPLRPPRPDPRAAPESRTEPLALSDRECEFKPCAIALCRVCR